jgi:hypothetical protein
MVNQFSQLLGSQDSLATDYCAISSFSVIGKRLNTEHMKKSEHISVKKTTSSYLNSVDISKLSDEDLIKF